MVQNSLVAVLSTFLEALRGIQWLVISQRNPIAVSQTL